ncbi:MAG: spermidine/putrescine import ATP-binding protein PotA [marine bacterium B5-7]|nr:MAG: spermidine/putrescine import ATP-binding protein PotA [marine bacterium B5-7]
MSADVRLENVWIKFGSFVAAREIELTIKGGEFFSFLGPSGCGKTTILRAVSGFLKPSEGNILIGGKDMAGIGPNRRPTALIFQNLALFPLMTVWENITFALEVKGVNATERRKKADELLELIALPGQGEKMVGELSGGQRQRVAIARALAAEPEVLLLDEPLSALDLKLRQHMRTELRSIQRRVGITFIYITHDQGEALTMSDNVAVMRDGVIEQVGDGTTIYDAPGSPFVASFVGENNLFRGTVESVDNGMATVTTTVGTLLAKTPVTASNPLKVGDTAYVFQRPESLRFAKPDNQINRIKATIVNEEFEGNFWQVYFEVPGSTKPVKMSMVNDGSSSERRRGEVVELVCEPELSVALAEGPLAAE